MSGLLRMSAMLLAATIASLVCADGELVPVDQEISAEQVLRLVDPEYPGLAAFAKAMQAGDLQTAHALLVEHFAGRESPTVPPAEFPGVGEGNSMIVIKASGASQATADEKWLKHIFTNSNNDVGKMETHELGPEIDWLDSPSTGFSWGLYLNQLNIVSKLAGVYRDTGDEKYATEVGDLLVSWTKQVPRGYGYTREGKLINSGMEVRNRLCNCIAAYDEVAASPSLTPEMHMAFWKLFITSCRELILYSGVSYPGLIPAAVMFPEFSESGQWLEAGNTDLRHHLVDRTTPEGAWDTHSISYQTVPVPWAARSLEFLRANSADGDFGDLPAVIEQQAGKLLEMMMRIAMPNGGMPNIGDTYGRSDWSAGAFIAPLTSWIALRLDDQQTQQLADVADPFARLKAALALADGTGTGEPATASTGFPGTGYYVMRSGWEPESARYLYFDLSAQAMGHAHNDASHFELYGYGKPLLTDTGDYFLGWGYRTALHNAIEVDGQQQVRGAAALMMPHEFISTDAYDLVDGAHSGYEGIGVTQRRKIIFVKPDYFILCDLLTGEGAHTYEQFFHFAGPTRGQPAQVALHPDTLAAATEHADVANVQVVPAHIDGLGASFVQAQETEMLTTDKFTREAMLGWMVTGGTFQRVKSPTAVYAREGELPQAFYDVLFPTPEGAVATLSVEALPVTAGGETVDPTRAACLAVECRVDKLAHDPNEIAMDLGENLALGKPGFVEINEMAFNPGREAMLTDGERGPRSIPAGLSSTPYTPGTHLIGRFGVEIGDASPVNCVVLHHGTWNGASMLYPPEEMSVQYWNGDGWEDAQDQVVTWRDDYVAEVHFAAVTTERISVAVERPSGGRLSMREFEAHLVAADEVQRVAALREERVVETWTDTLLISHEGPGLRGYGDFTFDGEMALVREMADGTLDRVIVHRGANLSRDGEVIVASGALLDTFAAQWQGAPIVIAENADTPAPVISDLQVQLQPPQAGLAGGQPWAMVTWQTDRSATTQVEFSAAGRGVRRTILDPAMDTEHSARVEFLRPDSEYTFAAVSVDENKARARVEAK